MPLTTSIRKSVLACALACPLALLSGVAIADQRVAPSVQHSLLERYTDSAQEAFASTKTGFEALADKGMSFLGIKYRFGGNGPENGGFDCSGLVRKVFGDALGLNLPRTAAEMAKLGAKVGKDEMKPGDLVFFKTMRRTFSHVGIYMGDNKFLHAPSTGGVVRVDKMDNSYWTKRFNGARRLMPESLIPEAQAATLPELLSSTAATSPQLPQITEYSGRTQ